MPEGMHPGQFRISRIQLFNWGTFNGYIEVPVPRKGFLITGGSGSGKSTLIDAISTVLVPPSNIHFNAAAQQKDTMRGGRTVVSYMRGAWRRGTDDVTGEFGSTFLRPGATCSGIALTYDNGLPEDGGQSIITLMGLYYLKAGDNSADGVRRYFGQLNGNLDLREVYPLLQAGIDQRGLKKKFPTAQFTNSHRVFSGRFRKSLGIANEEAQLLLHRTLSAKSLNSLDQLFRDYMLEQPQTFALADTAVEQFGELRQAYHAVQEVRAKIDVLKGLPRLSDTRATAVADLSADEQMQQALPLVQDMIHADLLREEIKTTDARLDSLSAAHSHMKELLARREEAVREAEFQLARLDGGRYEATVRQCERLRQDVDRRQHKRAGLTKSITALGGQPPKTAQEFTEIVASASRRIGDYEEERIVLRDRSYQLSAAHAQARSQVAQLHGELESFSRRKTNIDQSHIRIRTLLCHELGVGEKELPFAGELIEVKDAEDLWRGAIERILGGFALTLLVPAQLRDPVTRWINSHHLGVRLIYRVISLPVPDNPKRISPRALPRKLELAESSFTEWLTQELHARFSYECVDDITELAQRERALTVKGLVKHSRDRYEKDDRRPLGSQRDYRLGWSNHNKVELLRAELTKAEQLLGTCEQQLSAHDKKVTGLNKNLQCASMIIETMWEDIDVRGAEEQLAELTRRMTNWAVEHPDMALLEREVSDATLALAEIKEAEREANNAFVLARSGRDQAATKLTELETNIGTPVEEATVERVQTLFGELTRRITTNNIERTGRQAQQRLHNDRKLHDDRRRRADVSIVKILNEYLGKWPSERSDIKPEAEYVGEGIAHLTELRSDGLAKHQRRFLDLMNDMSTRNLGMLSTELRRARSDIEDRIRPVNESLAVSEYDTGRWLRINVRDSTSDVVHDFFRDLAAAVSGGMARVTSDDTASAEERFTKMAVLLDRLGSAELGDRRWRTTVLDTRRHVSFVGVEYNVAGAAVDTHRDSASLSGGQAQKLVFFCLAAALRYQLAEPDAAVPTYGTVVLDEAFDRADSEYTRRALNVFTGFGFHLILATPLKLLQTLSPYIGGTLVVSYKESTDADGGDTASSSVSQVEVLAAHPSTSATERLEDSEAGDPDADDRHTDGGEVDSQESDSQEIDGRDGDDRHTAGGEVDSQESDSQEVDDPS